MDSPNKVFLDSNFFVALFNPEDSLYEKAAQISPTLKSSNIEGYTSNFVFSEVVTILSQRSGRKNAFISGNQFLTSNEFQIIHVSPEVQKASWKIFQEVTRKNTSFVDCSIIAIMQAEGINKLLTFDFEDFAPLQKQYHFSLLK